MKHNLFLLLMLIPMISFAENGINLQDTTILLNGRKITIKEQGDKIKVKLYEKLSAGDTIANEQIFEGVYLNGQRSESRAALGGISFIKKKKRRNQYNYENCPIRIYIGYTLASDDFMSFSPSNKIDLNTAHSWEIGANLLNTYSTLGVSSNWALTAGLGWGYRSIRLDGNYAFREKEESTGVYPGESDEVNYSKSRLHYFYFRIPLALECQIQLNGYRKLFFAVGPEAEIRHGVRSKAKVNGHAETLDKGLNVRPVGINLLAQAGIGSIGAYMRYSTYGLFEKNKGPELYPFSFGLCWYW